MRLFYFFRPTDYSKDSRKTGYIRIELRAFFEEVVFSTPQQKEVSSFRYLDKVDSFIHTKLRGKYKFDFTYGKDNAHAHWAKSESELIADMREEGFELTDELLYFKQRELCLNLLYRHTGFLDMITGRNDYFYFNDSHNTFYDLRLASFHYHHSLHKDSFKERIWQHNNKIQTSDIHRAEFIMLHIPKNISSQRKFEAYSFTIEANHPLFSHATHRTLNSALDAGFSDRECSAITKHQYERLRKICKYLMFENDPLDISEVIKPQKYIPRVLGAT